jgi:hypothetical protein
MSELRTAIAFFWVLRCTRVEKMCGHFGREKNADTKQPDRFSKSTRKFSRLLRQPWYAPTESSLWVVEFPLHCPTLVFSSLRAGPLRLRAAGGLGQGGQPASL